MGRIWDDVIPEADRQVYAAAGYGGPVELGRRPAVLVVDVTYNFTGDRPEPVLESIKRFHNSCGNAAWVSMQFIARLLTAARAKQVPIFYTRGPLRKTALTLGGWQWTNTRSVPIPEEDDPGEQFPSLIAPRPGDTVIEKLKPSAFFGTPLMSMLTELRVDTLLVCGCTTSGCVRASVVDAFSYGLRVAVVEEGTFDRGLMSHKVNLFDMNQKYAAVKPLEEIIRYLDELDTAKTDIAVSNDY